MHVFCLIYLSIHYWLFANYIKSGGDPPTGESLPEDYKVFNFDTKDEREKAWAAKLLAGSGRAKNFSHSLSLRGPGHTGSSYTINSSNNSANNR